MTINRLFIVCLLVFGYLTWQKVSERGIEHPPGMLVTEAPVQRPTDLRPFAKGEFILAPQATFELEARVLSRKKYSGGAEGDLAPLDLALGWGPMSDQAILDQMRISQSGRWYFLRWDDAPPLPVDFLMQHSGNMHMIPADLRVRDVLNDVRPGNVVKLYGHLVNVSKQDGYAWNTSLSRNDTGDGACELFYVERAVITL